MQYLIISFFARSVVADGFSAVRPRPSRLGRGHGEGNRMQKTVRRFCAKRRTGEMRGAAGIASEGSRVRVAFFPLRRGFGASDAQREQDDAQQRSYVENASEERSPCRFFLCEFFFCHIVEFYSVFL